MIICSALYYPGSLKNGDLIVRDNRFYPGKYSETFPVWYQYVRKNYPNEHIVFFVDDHSPISIQPLLDELPEKYEEVSSRNIDFENSQVKIHVRRLSEHSGKYFWPMQRNLVEGILTAYSSKEDLFWLDNDAFLNTDIKPLLKRCDIAAPEIAHHQMTLDSVCTYISSRRLHSLDVFGVDLQLFMTNLLANGPQNTRMHVFQEGGLYKMFGYGNGVALGNSIELSHLSCYENFMKFLARNPMDTAEYKSLVDSLLGIDKSKLCGIETKFWDMNYGALKV